VAVESVGVTEPSTPRQVWSAHRKMLARLAAKNIGVQEIVAKLALGIVGSTKLDEVGLIFYRWILVRREAWKIVCPQCGRALKRDAVLSQSLEAVY